MAEASYKVWPNWYYGRNDYGRTGTMAETTMAELVLWPKRLWPNWYYGRNVLYPLQSLMTDQVSAKNKFHSGW